VETQLLPQQPKCQALLVAVVEVEVVAGVVGAAVAVGGEVVL
jgi:hypothetical protein